MSFSARYVPAVLFTLFSLAITVCAQSTTRQTSKTPRGSVSGRVTIKDKGAAGVAVGLRRSDRVGPFEPFVKGTTDQDGNYRVGNLPAGSYEVTPAAPAFVASDSIQKSKTVIVGENENVEGINFSLVRGGVITGKVTDADGRALIQQQVALYRVETFEQQQQQGPQRPLFATSSVSTDDRGIYRMYGLMSGRYKVAAGRSEDSTMGPFTLSRSTYKQVFHPDVSEPTRATVIEVREGSEATDVDITLGRALQTFSASGRVIDGERGVPIPNLRFGLQRSIGPRFQTVPTQVSSNAQGDFLIEGLIPGKYGVYLYQGSVQNPYPDMRAEALTFEIADQDVTGLTVKLLKGATLTGVVILENQDKAVLQKLQQMQLQAFVSPQGSSGHYQSSTSPIGPDGSFRLGGVSPGTANIFITTPTGQMEPKGFVVTRIERDGVSQLPRGVEVKDGENIQGLRVVISHGTAKLRGVVKYENGSLPPGSMVFLRLIKPGENFSNLPQPRADVRGHFLLEGVPAGTYELHVTVTGTLRRQVTQSVTMQDGAVTDVVVTIDLGPTPK